MYPRHHVGFNPYLMPRGRAGAPLVAAPGAVAQALAALGSFATAQGGNPALLRPSSAGLRGHREPFGLSNGSMGGAVGSASTMTGQSEEVFRPSRLILQNNQDSTNACFAVTAILCGPDTALANGVPIPGGLFLPTGVECGITFNTIQAGNSIRVTVSNNTTTTTTVFGAFLGEDVRGTGYEIGG